MVVNQTSGPFAGRGAALAIAVISILSSSGQLLKWTGIAGLAVYAVLILTLALLATSPRFLAPLWNDRKKAAMLMVAACLLLVVAFLVLYPVAHSGRFGPGTDRDEEFNLALGALLHGHYPYYVTTRFHAPVTPLTGALLLAIPFYLLGNAAWQDLFWIPVFAFFCWRFFRTAKQSILFFGIFLCANLSFLQDYVTGGEYGVNLIYITMATAFFAVRIERAGPLRSLLLPALCLGVAMASRPIYFVVLPILFFYGRSRIGIVASFSGCLLAFLVSAALIAPLYFYDPAGFSPLHITRFAGGTIPHATLLLPALALATTLLAIWLPLDRYGIFGLLAGAMCFIFLPGVIVNFGDFTPGVVDLLDYTYPVAFFGGLWLSALTLFRAGPERSPSAAPVL